jgi:hypothetical protein
MMAQGEHGSLSYMEPWPDLEWVGEADYKSAVSFIITQIRELAVMEEFPLTRLRHVSALSLVRPRPHG